MAQKKISHRRKNDKKKGNVIATSHVPLCALGEVIQEKQFFAPIHDHVTIAQKVVDYHPTDKLVFATIGLIAGAETVYDLNQILRPNRPLLNAFGYEKCADQSVIQETINAATEENVGQLNQAAKQMFSEHNRILFALDSQTATAENLITLDIDLSPLPASKKSQGSKKGYDPNKKNQYLRQLARVLSPSTSEIITQSLYPGNTVSCSVFKEMVKEMENHLDLDSKTKRQQVRLRIDAGFGTDGNLNFALWGGYHILAKIFSSKRASKLAKTVDQWVCVPSEADNTTREAGLVQQPHRYCRKTMQVAIRTPKKKGGYSYSVLVTTQMDQTVSQIVTDYDKRSGVPESSFCQDYQGLALRKRRKGGLTGQKILLVLSQIAHNLIVWIKNWFNDALEMSLFSGEQEPKRQEQKSILLAIRTIQERGIKRFMRQILMLSGRVIVDKKKVVTLLLNPLYPLIKRIKTALQAFLKPYNIRVLLDEI